MTDSVLSASHSIAIVHFFNSISDDHREWAVRQPLFFIASVPLDGKYINCSPKSQTSATLTIIDSNRMGYIDANGSGIETVSHAYENGRATIMFCSFEKSPRITRWLCKGRVIEVDYPDFNTWFKRMEKPEYPCIRAIIPSNMFKVQTSCGFAVPLLSHRVVPDKCTVGAFTERKTLENFAKKFDSDPFGMEAYRAQFNSRSLDRSPGLRKAIGNDSRSVHVDKAKYEMKRILHQWDAILLGALVAVLAIVYLQPLAEVPVLGTGA